MADTNTYQQPDTPPDFEVPEHRVDREIYAMPAFTTLPVADLEASTQWYEAMGFVVLARMGAGPMQLVHLRRYRYQDILLVPATREGAGDDGRPDARTTSAASSANPPEERGRARTSFSHTGPLDDLDEIVASLVALDMGTVAGPDVRPWHAVEVEAVDADGHQVALTARPDTPPPTGLADEVRASLVDE